MRMNLNLLMQTPKHYKRIFTHHTHYSVSRESHTRSNLVNAAWSKHDGGEGQKAVSLQQHAAHTALAAGDEDTATGQAALEDFLRLWGITTESHSISSKIFGFLLFKSLHDHQSKPSFCAESICQARAKRA